MTDLMKTEFLVLMNKTSQEIRNEQIQSAYEDFVTQAVFLNEPEVNYSEAFRVYYFESATGFLREN